MWPFVDSVTKSKVRFSTPEELGATGDVHEDVLLKECGGKVDVSLLIVLQADGSFPMITRLTGPLYWRSAWRGGKNSWKPGDRLVRHKLGDLRWTLRKL